MKESKEKAFTEENLMLLGILDEVYDLYQMCCILSIEALDRKKAEQKTASVWPNNSGLLCNWRVKSSPASSDKKQPKHVRFTENNAVYSRIRGQGHKTEKISA